MKHWSLVVLVVWVGVIYAPILRGQQPQSPQTVVPGVVQPPAPGIASQPAIAVTTVPSPAAPQNPLDQIEWAVAMSYLLRYVMKKQWIGFLTPASTQRAKAVCAFLVAFATAAGIHLAVNGSPFDGHGASVTITGLSFDAIKDVGFQWVSQQAWYDGLVKRVTA